MVGSRSSAVGARSSTSASATTRPDRPTDFPRINDAYTGQAHRYGYVGHATRWNGDDIAFDGVTKWDLASGTEETFRYGPTHLSGEAAFAADPDRVDAEDGGWLLNFATDAATDQTSLIVLDAADISAGPVCEVKVPRRVPFGFHGNWMASLLP